MFAGKKQTNTLGINRKFPLYFLMAVAYGRAGSPCGPLAEVHSRFPEGRETRVGLRRVIC
jgi:hypothetical protein